MEDLHKLFILKSRGIDILKTTNTQLEYMLIKLDDFCESSKLESNTFDDFLETGLPGLLTKVKGKYNSDIPLGVKIPGRFKLLHEEMGSFIYSSTFISSPILSIKRKECGYVINTFNSEYNLDLLIDD